MEKSGGKKRMVVENRGVPNSNLRDGVALAIASENAQTRAYTHVPDTDFPVHSSEKMALTVWHRELMYYKNET